MKTLKFMLAAATAIGLSSAYAEPDQGASTSFEGLGLGTSVISGITDVGGAGDSFFHYAGNAEDNESQIVAFEGSVASRPRGAVALAPTSEKMLQVSTGTDPLIRTLNSFATGNEPEEAGFTADVYVDTLVQFTVTPYTDTVTPGDADKLMVYLKESTNSVGEVVSTNLVVWGGYYDGNAYSKTEYVAQDVEILPNTWYRLTVKAVANYGALDGYSHPAFFVYLNGDENPVVFDKAAVAESLEGYAAPFDEVADSSAIDNKNVVFSLLCDGNAPAALLGVGFAGEGKVDDLMITTLDPFVTALDFTLTWGSALTPVEYTITNTTFSLSGAAGTSTMIKVPVDYPAVTFTFANGDGVTKTRNATASGEVTELNVSDAEFVWADYLGEAVSGAYVIDDAAELLLFKKGVATLGTSGQTFKLGGNIDATDLGYFDGIGTASGTNGSSGLNGCTFDGAGYTISNVKFSNAKYRGFFNQVLNSTIKDLTINVVDIAQHSNPSAEHGYSAFAGNMKNSKIQNCVATGTIGTTAKPAMHTCGGFAVKSDGGNIFENCSNDVDIVCSLNDNPKIGGIFGLAQTGSVALTNCWNSGDLTITCEDCGDVGNGAGGLAGYAASALTIHGGGNTGTITWSKTTAGNATKDIAIKIGTIIAMQNSSTATVTGGVVAQADATPAGAFANVTGLNFATVDGNVATFVDTLAAGNTYKVMNAAATPTYQFTAPGTIAFDESLTAPTAYAITAASGLAAQNTTAGNVKTYYATDWAAAPAEHPWYENPGAVVLAQNLPGQTGNIVSAFHGQGEGEYLGLTYSTNPQQFDLFTVDGTNTPTTVMTLPSGDASLNMPGFRGVAISKTLGIAMTLAYYTASNMYVFPLTGGAATVVSKPSTYSFDAAAFSPDGKYLFSNALNGESSNQYYVKWAVSDGGATLTKVGSISAGGRGRNLAYARINGRDLVFAMIDTGKVAVLDMTGDDDTAWTAADLITGLPAHSYGSLCVSGVKVTGGTPHLTVATSTNNGATKIDVLNVYALTVPAAPDAVSAALVKSFDEDAMTAAGFGDISDANRYGNTVYVTEDEATIYFARPDNKLYAAQYVESASSDWVVDPTEIPDNTSVADQYPALADSVLATADAKQVTEWAASKNIDFAAVQAATSGTTYSDAFLLNCAPTAEAVAEEEEEFVLTITFDASGNPVVNLPAGKKYNGTVQMKGSNDLSTWNNVEGASSSYKFYKYELSL